MSQAEQEEPTAAAAATSASEVARIPKRERPQSEASGDSLRQEHKRQLIGAAVAAASMDEAQVEAPTLNELDPSQVQAARRLELDRLVEFGVYRSVPRAEASHVIGTRWVEVQKKVSFGGQGICVGPQGGPLCSHSRAGGNPNCHQRLG
jgi:hypothetical protein